MTSFTAPFKYYAYIIMLLLLAATLVLLYKFVYFEKDMVYNFGFTPVNLLTLGIGTLAFGFCTAKLIYNIFTFRFSVEIVDAQVTLIDNMLFKKQNVTQHIKGFSASTTRNGNSKTTILYLDNDRIINFHRAFVTNQVYIEPAFFKLNFKFLGNEILKPRYIVGREYKYKQAS